MTEKDIVLEEEESKSIAFMSEEEKQHVVKYDEHGQPLYYVGDNHWIPPVAFVSKEEILKAKSHYPKPRIYPLRIIVLVLIPIILSVLIDLVVYWIIKANGMSLEFKYYLMIAGLFLAFYLLLHAGSIAILCIQFYQAFAKDEVRERCSLTPTCSFYMIYAIEKYGFIIGLIKGIKRLKRCAGQEEEDWP